MASRKQSACVVRLTTSFYMRGGACCFTQSLRPVKRLCSGWSILEEEVHQIGVKETLQRITNLSECPEGLYRLIVVNQQRDWETGAVEDYDLMLVPYNGGIEK